MTSEVRQWRLPDPDAATRKLATVYGSLVGVLALGAVLASTGRVRLGAVVLVMTIGLAVFHALDTRRHRATRLSVDASGLLTIGDGRRITTADLRGTQSIGVRPRATSGQSLLKPRRHWAIEGVGPAGAFSHRLPFFAGYWSQSEAVAQELEEWLRGALAGVRGEEVVPPPHATAAHAAVPAPQDANLRSSGPTAAPPPGTVVLDAHRFTWSPPRRATAVRNQRLVQLGFGIPAGALALWAVVTMWADDPVGAVVTAVTVPGFLLLAGVGFDAAYRNAAAFRLDVVDGLLTVTRRWRAPVSVPLASARVEIDLRRSVTSTGDGAHTSTRWHLVVVAPTGDKLDAQLPSFGLALTTETLQLVEAELRRRAER